ncbi:hypothetical protein QTO34_019491 [Cnephaeus nilssonii]|uniref:Ig-like domain-containing protein n=1 Tax=Cnephaeus nilssonii TaxID=3371016 RepID=A0AA40HXT9_CNENI|nr:hypothetical protein QTO34_019491 [Eptesicus nilssonii]
MKVEQSPSALSLQEGTSSTLRCNFSMLVTYVQWFRQNPRGGLTSLFYVASDKKHNRRLSATLNSKDLYSTLNITASRLEDSATYLCAVRAQCCPVTCSLYPNCSWACSPTLSTGRHKHSLFLTGWVECEKALWLSEERRGDLTTAVAPLAVIAGPQLTLSGKNDEDVHWSFVHVPVAAVGLHGEKVDQHSSTLSVQEGNTAVITCSYSDSGSDYFPWYKQELGKGPQFIIDIRSNKDKNPVERLTAFLNKTAKHLSLHIAATQPGDSAVYFCAASTHCFPGTCILYTNLSLQRGGGF